MSRVYTVVVPVIGNIEKSLRQFKKKFEREGVGRDIKRCAYYEKPTQKRRKQRMRAIKNAFLRSLEPSE